MKVVMFDLARPVRVWATDVDAGTLEQAGHLARLPFAAGPVALMPDTHVGYGMPIGGVLATEGAVIPNAVGVDIGCGMLAARLDLAAEELTRERLAATLGRIRKAVPVGFGHHAAPQQLSWTPGGAIGEREHERARTQVGTLGGGNHFIEIQAGDDGRAYVMIHSGSRNVGYKVAEHYNAVAKGLNARWHSTVPPEWDLAFLPLDADEGADYMAEMAACCMFALVNRERMMWAVLGAVQDAVARPVEVETWRDVAHNYVAAERHGGRSVLVHRKGAIRASAGEFGIIPGSQGTRSYLVRGLGNPLSYESCSHGAGRRMGRKQAQRELDLAAEQARLDAAGVLHAVRGKGDLDEAPGAYKDIDEVMANQTDLVEVMTTLRPLAVVKG